MTTTVPTAHPMAHLTGDPAHATAEALHAALQAALRPTMLEVLDESAQHAGHAGTQGRSQGTHFRVRIASPELDALSRVDAHRLVYDALSPFLDAGLHALAIERIPSSSV